MILPGDCDQTPELDPAEPEPLPQDHFDQTWSPDLHPAPARPGYFQTMGIRLLRVRGLQGTDTKETPDVVALGESLGRREREGNKVASVGGPHSADDPSINPKHLVVTISLADQEQVPAVGRDGGAEVMRPRIDPCPEIRRLGLRAQPHPR